MGGESVERLMDIILQMRINVAHINEALQQQTFEICRELIGICEDQRKFLEGYLSAVDAKLKECATRIDDYRRHYASLTEIGVELDRLGAEPGALPTELPRDGLEAVLLWRIDELRKQGRL